MAQERALWDLLSLYRTYQWFIALSVKIPVCDRILRGIRIDDDGTKKLKYSW